MPLNEKKIISIVLTQCEDVEERCKGYREEIINVISDILMYERNHRVSHTTIQKNINDKCSATGRFLARQQVEDSGTEELN